MTVKYDELIDAQLMAKLRKATVTSAIDTSTDHSDIEYGKHYKTADKLAVQTQLVLSEPLSGTHTSAAGGNLAVQAQPVLSESLSGTHISAVGGNLAVQTQPVLS